MAKPRNLGLTAGDRLRQRRTELGLSLREVNEATLLVASRFGNEEFAISRSRLSDIEIRDAMPNAFRLYSLAEVYKLDLLELISWYGIECTTQKSNAQAASSGGT